MPKQPDNAPDPFLVLLYRPCTLRCLFPGIVVLGLPILLQNLGGDEGLAHDGAMAPTLQLGHRVRSVYDAKNTVLTLSTAP